jgi:hypothetical protein
VQDVPLPPESAQVLAGLLKTVLPYVGAGLTGFIASNFTVGKRFAATMSKLATAMQDRDRHVDARMARVEGALFGLNGSNGGLTGAVESLGGRMGADHDILVRLAGAVDGLRDTVRAVDTSVRAALAQREPPQP